MLLFLVASSLWESSGLNFMFFGFDVLGSLSGPASKLVSSWAFLDNSSGT